MSSGTDVPPISLVDNRSANRYEFALPRGMALISYKRSGDRIALVHMETPPATDDETAALVIRAALDDVRAQGLKLVPLCQRVARYVQRHASEYDDIVHHYGRR
jgi:hypothetical protein